MKLLVVDDEPLAREGLRLQLQQLGWQACISECSSGRQAVELIRRNRPDLVLLDINMPEGDGFSVIDSIGVQAMPLVIFLTAYDDYALQAFNVNALDYLLKPVSNARLQESLQRAQQQLQDRAGQQQQLQALMAQLESGQLPGQAPRLMIRSGGHVHFLRISDILWVQADGDYVTVHTVSRSHLLRETMKNMSQRLQPHGFQRIHRSALVRLDLIRELIANDNGDYRVLLHDDTELKLSRSYRDELCERLRVNFR